MTMRDVFAALVGALVGGLVTLGAIGGGAADRPREGKRGARAIAAAEADRRGARDVGPEASRGAATAEDGAPTAAEAAYARANRNLVDRVRELDGELAALQRRRVTLEEQLAAAKKSAAAAAGGDAAPPKSPFDLSQEDWKTLAKDGTIKFQIPCVRPKPYEPSPDTLAELGLGPGDGAVLREAYARSNERVWSEVGPICTEMLGNAQVAERLGADTCTHLVLNMSRSSDAAASNEAMRQVAEIRAGLRAPPGPGDAVAPVERLFLTLTGENARFEAELASKLGAAEAHRVAYSDTLCRSASTFGGPGARGDAP